jgi:hypothetical protein
LATAQDHEALHDAITYYYQRSSDVVSILTDWERSGSKAPNPLTGFLAGLFAKHPEQIEHVTDATLGLDAQIVVVRGLLLADGYDLAIAAAEKWGWPAEQVGNIVPHPALRGHKAENPEQFDLMWGASFATGDEAYVRPVFEYYSSAVDRQGVEVGDVVRLALAFRTEDKDAMIALRDKYSDDVFPRLVNATAALWSLESNSRQHKFVADAVNRFFQEQPGSAAASGFLELRKHLQ